MAGYRGADEAITAQAVLDGIPASAVLLDLQGRIVATNHSWVDFCIKNGGQVSAVGPPTDYIAACAGARPASTAREVIDGITAVLQRTLERFDFEYPCHGPDSERWFQMTVTPVPHGALIIHHDITGEYARISRWLASTSLVLLELDPSANAVYVNAAWAARARLPVRRLLGPHWTEHLDTDQAEILINTVHQVAKSGHDQTVDIRLPDHDQPARMRFTVTAYFDEHRTLRRLTLIGIDVTEQHARPGPPTTSADPPTATG